MALKRILIVHPDLQESSRLGALLHRTGQFASRSANDAFDAAVRIFGESYSCLILHIGTPGFDPVRVVQKIRSTGSTAQLPILVLFGNLNDERLNALLRRSAATALLQEPVADEELIDALRRLTGIDEAQAKTKRSRKRARRKARRRAAGAQTQVPAVQPSPGKRRAALADAIIRRAQKGADLPGMPPWVSRLDSLIADLTGEAVSKEVVGIDLRLVVAILRMVNSTYYRALEPIACLTRAMGRLGQRAVTRVLVDSWAERSKTPEVIQGFLLSGFWKHNLWVACLAEEIARATRYPDHSAVFSAGLLHDVGKLFMVSEFPDEYVRVQHRLFRTPSDGAPDPSPIERELMGIDHGQVGQELCRGWFLPPIVAAGTLHHQFDGDRTRLMVDGRVTGMVAMANLLAHHLDQDRPAMPHTAASEAGGDAQVDGSAGAPRLRIVVTHAGKDLGAAVVECADSFLYEAAPPWVLQFIEAGRFSVEGVMTRAERRVGKAVRGIGLAA